MLDENLINNLYVPRDLKQSQAYVSAMNPDPLEIEHYTVQYHHSMIDSDNVNDSIKVKILYNELMKLKAELSNERTILRGQINTLTIDHKYLVEENKRLSDEVASIKQSLYFG